MKRDLETENSDGEDSLGAKWYELKWLDKYVKPPNNRYIAIYNLIAITANAISIFLVYYECSFRLKVFDSVGPFNLLLEIILTLEIILIMFKAYPDKDDSNKGWLYPLYTLPCICCRKKKVKKHDTVQKV